MSIAAVRGWTQRSRKTALAVATTLVIVTAPYWEVLTGRRTAMHGDVNDFYVPEYVEAWRAIRAGHWPWWTPNVFAGHSMLGAGQYAVFYPANALFGWLDPPTAYRWWFFAHIWVAALGAFAWSWHRWRSRPGAVVSGAAYALSGFIVLHLVHPAFIAAAAWLPFVFLGVDLVLERWSSPRALVVAGPLALIVLIGAPQMLWIAGLGCLVYTGSLAVARRCDWAGIGRAAGALACGIGIGAIQLIPQYLFGRTSVRPTLTMTAAFENSITPHQLLMLGFPYLFGGSTRKPSFAAPYLGGGLYHEVGSYLGITIIAIAVVGVVVLRRNRAVWAFVMMMLVAVLIGLGGSTPVGHFVYLTVLGAKEFRNWGRTLLLANLAVAMLAGAGVRELLRAPRRVLEGLVWGVAGLAFVALLLPHVGIVRQMVATGSAGVIARAVPVVLLLGLAGAVALAVRNRRAGAILIILVCALDLVSYAASAPWRGESLTPAQAKSFYDTSVPPVFGSPHDAPGGVDRWASNWYGFRAVSLAKDILSLNMDDPLIQKDWAATAGGWLADGYPLRSDLWQPGWTSDVLRVSTLVLSNDVAPTDSSWQRVGGVPGLDFTRWVRAPRLADAYLVGAVDLAPLATIQSQLLNPYARLKDAAYVERRTPAMADLTQPGAAGSVVAADLLGSGNVVVDARRAALLVLSEDWEDGWRATVDGKSVPVVRADGLVIGIAVPRGRHVVHVSFHPPGLRLGVLVALLAVLALFNAAPLVSLVRSTRRSGTLPAWLRRKPSDA